MPPNHTGRKTHHTNAGHKIDRRAGVFLRTRHRKLRTGFPLPPARILPKRSSPRGSWLAVTKRDSSSPAGCTVRLAPWSAFPRTSPTHGGTS
jgi:hypothetical protein